MFELRDKKMASEILAKLKKMNLDIRLMHVCGTHQDTLVRFGLIEMLAEVGVEVRQGPGCPVCVTTPKEIEEALALARAGKTVAIFGDMLRVPSKSGSLLQAKSEGADVRVVYSIEDALGIAKKTKDEVIFVAVGFETTAPTTASVIWSSPPSNFSVLSCHRTLPNVLRALVESGKIELDGLIEPGHVSVITGTKIYDFLSKEYDIPQVVAGFEPLDMLMGVYMLARQIEKGEAKVENAYARAVTRAGNPRAQKAMEEVFEQCNVKWRGFPVLPGTGLNLKTKYAKWDARVKFSNILAPIQKKDYSEPHGCMCGAVLRGEKEPSQCPLFGKKCRPSSPIGPCMVSREGGCAIEYKYRRRKSE